MSYKVLYRKYRPDTFKGIVGQKTIVDNLKKSVEENSFSHAYIFTGPRGTGKTSTAKILAKSLVCTNVHEGEPCGECENCKNFATSPDIIEIDAASNNGVGEIRELRNNITLAPAESKYKIYIIDEVHMLTNEAFNALLKTLEEPPAHAIFILATTEIYKVPITILSRCQRFDFKKIEKSDMLEHLKYVCEQEKIEYEEGVLEEIYELSEGCLRDALSILDQTSKSEKSITLNGLLKSYNMISNQSVSELLGDIKAGSIEKLIEKISSYEDAGINAQKLLKRMINYLEKVAIDIKLGKNKEFPFSTISNLINNLNKCYIDARINENVYTIIKLSFLEATNSESLKPTETKKMTTETQKTSTPPQEKKAEKKREIVEEPQTKDLSIADIRINNCFAAASKDALNTTTEKWYDIASGKITGIDTLDYKPVAASDAYAIFTAEEDSLANLFNIKNDDIEKVLKKGGLDIKVVALTTSGWLKEKEKYKNNLKRNKKYEYIEEPKKEEGSEIKKEAEDLFTEKLVEMS